MLQKKDNKICFLFTFYSKKTEKKKEFYEGSCDTEDWSTDAKNSALHHMNKLHFQIYSNRKQLI